MYLRCRRRLLVEELTLLMLREQVWVAEKKNRLLFAESTKAGSQRAGRGNPPPFRQLFLHGVPVARGGQRLSDSVATPL